MAKRSDSVALLRAVVGQSLGLNPGDEGNEQLDQCQVGRALYLRRLCRPGHCAAAGGGHHGRDRRHGAVVGGVGVNLGDVAVIAVLG